MCVSYNSRKRLNRFKQTNIWETQIPLHQLSFAPKSNLHILRRSTMSKKHGDLKMYERESVYEKERAWQSKIISRRPKFKKIKRPWQAGQSDIIDSMNIRQENESGSYTRTTTTFSHDNFSAIWDQVWHKKMSTPTRINSSYWQHSQMVSYDYILETFHQNIKI